MVSPKGLQNPCRGKNAFARVSRAVLIVKTIERKSKGFSRQFGPVRGDSPAVSKSLNPRQLKSERIPVLHRPGRFKKDG